MNNIICKIAAVMAFFGLFSCTSANNDTIVSKVLEPSEYISTLEADENAYLLDVRRADEYAEGHLPGAALLDVTDSTAFAKGIEQLDKKKTIYIYCRSGRRSQTAAKRLTEKGFKVIDMKGGYNAWKEYTNK